ncbi:MAG: hypothetical protein CBC38_03535 [Gammaproteobacteria bacterium TMED78]|nr:MAG: hypothetical protein CBC38_03535 [Gammaproteobacteria bacterium TMED78]|tara:strand:+ start:206 stop:595 length:390 start_codon:yes stop_codon:yes gene_type:complete
MKLLDSLFPIVHWPIRICIALTYLVHGAGKIPYPAIIDNFGIPPAFAYFITFCELSVVPLLIIGGLINFSLFNIKDFLTRLGGLIVIATMIGAIIVVHNSAWDYRHEGMEFQALLLSCGLYFLVRGNKV